MYDPKTNKFPYPLETDHHYLVVKKNDGTVFDKDYPYIDHSKWFNFKRGVVRVLLYVIVFPLAKIRMGIKVKGKENLKKNKALLKKGVISVANHVHMWDYIAIMRTVKPFKPYLLAWAPNVSGELGGMVRMVGGIPIPENDFQATIAYLNTLTDLLNKGGWLHIYSEGSMWEYYAPVRPFKKGPAHLAVMCDKPILPIGFSYRKPGWIRRKIFKQIACFNINVGEPIFANKELNKAEQEVDLTERSHDAICDLVGINPEESMYEKVFNNSKRIDYYTDTYGVGYTGSK